jgi:acetyltransferase
MAFIAVNESTGEMLGVVRLHTDADYDTAEFAILVRSDQKGHGLGWQLMQLIIEYARAQAIRSVHGQVLQENAAMLDMCRNLGFQVKADPQERSIVVVTLSL